MVVRLSSVCRREGSVPSCSQGLVVSGDGMSGVAVEDVGARSRISGVNVPSGVIDCEAGCGGGLLPPSTDGDAALRVDERRLLEVASSTPSTPKSSRYRSPSARLMASSGSGSLSSSSSGRLLLPLVINHTPKKVIAHPPMNLPASSADFRSKSLYRIAEPRMTESVKRTNCTGITCVASNRWRARLMYLIYMTAVPTKIATSKYVTGNVMARHSVYESMDATPLVERAV